MKKSIKKHLIGKLLLTIAFLFFVYIVYSFVFWLSLKSNETLLRWPDKPLFIHMVYWTFSFAIIASIMRIYRNPMISWLTINVCCLGNIILTLISLYFYFYYDNYLDYFTPAILSICLLFIINSKKIKQKYNIIWKVIHIFIILIIPAVLMVTLFIVSKGYMLKHGFII